MKTNLPHNTDEEQELKRFKAASQRLVRSAAQDPAVAREFLAATGYFEVMAKADAAARKAATGTASRAQRKTVKAR